MSDRLIRVSDIPRVPPGMSDTLISLSDIPGGTRVAYSADVQVGGLIAGVGQRMLGGVSKMMADEFFNRMGELLTTA